MQSDSTPDNPIANYFAGLTVEQWCEWLQVFMNDGEPEPYLCSAGDEPDGVLASVYLDLRGASRTRFAEAIANLFESTPFVEGNQKLLWRLLNLVALVKPLASKPILTKHLIDESALYLAGDWDFEPESGFVENLWDSPYRLHTLVLSARGEYALDDLVLQYIFDSAWRIGSGDYVLACFRLAASIADTRAYELITRFIAILNSDSEAEDLALELKAEFKRLSYQPFCVWYCRNAHALAREFPHELRLVENKILRFALPRRDKAGERQSENYRTLLALQLEAGERIYDGQELLNIARLHKTFGIEMTTQALTNIWRIASNYLQKPAWEYLSIYEGYVGGSRQSHLREVGVSLDGSMSFVPFNAAEEPELEIIFERVKSVDILGDPVESIEEAYEEERTITAAV